MKKIVLFILITVLMTSCHVSFKTTHRRNGLRPLWYSPRTHYGPFYKYPKPKQMKPHFNRELPHSKK